MGVRQRLSHIGTQEDRAIDLVAAALDLAAWTEPGLEPAPYHRHVLNLTNDAHDYVHGDDITAALAAEAVRQILNRRYGYATTIEPGEQGDGVNLARVIDTRRGAAVALCVLYDHVLRSLGVSAEILNFPARALVRIEDPNGRRLVLDPANGGRAVDARALRTLYREHRGGDGELDPFHLSPMSARDVLVALQDQVKAHHLRMAAPEAALAALEGALLCAPNTARLWREAGLLHARLDHIGDAISALEHFLDLPGGDVHRYTASQLLQQLQSREDKNRT